MSYRVTTRHRSEARLGPIIASLFLSLFLVTSMSGCGWVKRNTIGLIWKQTPTESETVEPAKRATTSAQTSRAASVDVEKLKTDRPRTVVEVVWRVPEHPDQEVDGYLIRYGYSPQNLQYEQKVEPSEVTPVNDPEKGRVYKYTLKKIPEGKKVYVTVSSFRGAESSEASTPIEEAPATEE